MKVLPSEKSESEVHKEEYEANEKPGLDRGLTSYTGWLAVFTLALFLIAAVQVGLPWKQLKLMRDTLIEAKTAAEAAKESAEAARDSVKLAQDIAKRQLRTYLVPQI